MYGSHQTHIHIYLRKLAGLGHFHEEAENTVFDLFAVGPAVEGTGETVLQRALS